METIYTMLGLANIRKSFYNINALDMKLLYNLIPLSLPTGWSSYAIAFKQGTVLGITNKFLQSGSTVFCTE